jgi:hypothetical protein
VSKGVGGGSPICRRKGRGGSSFQSDFSAKGWWWGVGGWGGVWGVGDGGVILIGREEIQILGQ